MPDLSLRLMKDTVQAIGKAMGCLVRPSMVQLCHLPAREGVLLCLLVATLRAMRENFELTKT